MFRYGSTMLLEIIDKDLNSSFIIDVKRFEDAVVKSLPFDAEARVWKEEVYFETPIVIEAEEDSYRVEKGRVYFWRPGRALCLFYGETQIYTPGIHLGIIVDPLHRLRSVADGHKIRVEKHETAVELNDFVVRLKGLGYTVGTPLDNGVRIVTATKYIGSLRISMSIFAEEYGFHIESEAIARYSTDIDTLMLIHRLRSSINNITRFTRIDVSEDGWIVVTACGRVIEEFENIVEDFEKAVILVKELLNFTP